MKTIAEVIALSSDYLASHHIERPKREAEELLALVLQMKRIDLYLEFMRPLEEKELSQMRELLQKRARGIPFGYLAKQMAFFGALLEITPDVLVPRPETEIFVERICQQLEAVPLENSVLWDVCTGSGCIGIAIKKRFPQLEVVLSDISPQAALVAQNNCVLNKMALSVHVGDLFTPFGEEKCKFLVCNPPYLSQSEYEHVSKEVKMEPKIALVAEEDGLAFYRRLAEQLPHRLEVGGRAFFEIGASQEESVMEIFKNAGYDNIKVERDYAGHPRFFFLE
jgi:release factor glutamine methyltransferase